MTNFVFMVASSRRGLSGLFAVLVGVLTAAGISAPESGQGAGIVTNEEISAMIRDLGDDSYERRAEATRRLCAVGSRAIPQLESASRSDHAEISLRSQYILARLDELWFSDVDVTVSLSKQSVKWDEPVDLIVSFQNRSKLPARLPFARESLVETLAANRASDAADTDARQVGAMLDIADFLRVTGPDSAEVELKMDDIGADPSVMTAVQERLSGAKSVELEPGSRAELRVSMFNRGWSRYPLLDRGAFEIVFDYLPVWNDQALNDAKVGRVAGGPAVLVIEDGAPEAVSRDGQELSLGLEREGEAFVAAFVNHADRPCWINMNVGAGVPFAEAAWVVAGNDFTREIPLAPKRAPTWHSFDEQKLVEVAPGKSLESARIGVAELRALLREMGVDPGIGRLTVHLNYSNLLDRAWQSRQSAAVNEAVPKVLRQPLPPRLMAVRLASRRLVLPEPVRDEDAEK
jgi:hypothetical protein